MTPLAGKVLSANPFAPPPPPLVLSAEASPEGTNRALPGGGGRGGGGGGGGGYGGVGGDGDSGGGVPEGGEASGAASAPAVDTDLAVADLDSSVGDGSSSNGDNRGEDGRGTTIGRGGGSTSTSTSNGGSNGNGGGGDSGGGTSRAPSFTFDGSVFRDAGRLFGAHVGGKTYTFGKQRVEVALRKPGGLRLGIWRPPFDEREERDRLKERGTAASETVLREEDRWGGGGAGALSFVACLSHLIIGHASFRDGAPFLLLIETPPTFGRSVRFFRILHYKKNAHLVSLALWPPEDRWC